MLLHLVMFVWINCYFLYHFHGIKLQLDASSIPAMWTRSWKSNYHPHHVWTGLHGTGRRLAYSQLEAHISWYDMGAVGSSSSAERERALWKKIWGADVPSKVRVFAWKVINNGLPTSIDIWIRNVAASCAAIQWRMPFMLLFPVHTRELFGVNWESRWLFQLKLIWGTMDQDGSLPYWTGMMLNLATIFLC